MNEHWEIVTIGDICDVGRGASPRPIKDPKNFGGSIPWIKIADASSEQKYVKKTVHTVTEYGASKSKFLKKGSLIVANSGTVGFARILALDGCIHDGWLYLTNFRKTMSDYLFYTINYYRHHFEQLASGATQKNLNLSLMKNFKIQLPDLSTQKNISSILGTYDNLIENNTRRIQILEEMPQRIYKEWFVDFKYPGYEKDQLVDSELGMIPEGWKVKKTDEVFGVLGGGTPSTKIPEYWENGIINWYSPKDLTKSNSMFMLKSGNQISELGLQKSSAKLFPAFSVMLTSRATIGVVSINTTEACTNQGFISCVPSEHMSTYQIYYWLLSNNKMFLAHSSGATFKELTKTTFKKFDLVVPPKTISRLFNDLVIPFTDQIYNLQKQQETLRQTRDLLLPKLISGKIDVSDLDIDISILND